MNPFDPSTFNLPDLSAFGRTGEKLQGMGQSVGENLLTLSRMQILPQELARIQGEYLREAAELWNSGLQSGGKVSLPKDRRFAGSDWYPTAEPPGCCQGSWDGRAPWNCL